MNHKIEVQNEEQKENTYVYLITFRPLGRTISEKRKKLYQNVSLLNYIELLSPKKFKCYQARKHISENNWIRFIFSITSIQFDAEIKQQNATFTDR